MDKYLKYKKKYLELKYKQIGSGFSQIHVYNNLYNIVELINYSNYDEKIHKFIDDKKLEEIAKKNDEKIKKVIKSESNYNKKFYHVSTKEFPYPIIDKQYDLSSWVGKNIYKNPNGVWD